MDERAIKRLLIIVAASLVAIFVLKSAMYRTIVNLNRIAAERKQTGTRPTGETRAVPPASVTNVESAPASAADEVEPLPASGAGEAR